MRSRRNSLPFLALASLLPWGGAARADDPAPDADRLARYAADTWRSMAAMERPGGLPADHLRLGPDGSWIPAGYTSPTNIASYLWSVLAAEAMGIIEPAEADARLDRTLTALAAMRRDQGFFLAWYDPASGAPLAIWPDDGAPIRPFLSCVDNGWLACALIMVGNSRPEWQLRTEALLAPMDFGFFFDADAPGAPTGLLRVGYWVDTASFTASHYGMLNTEPRIASYVGIARGQLPPEHYYRMVRHPGSGPGEASGAAMPTYLGVPVHEGASTYRGRRFVPSWGGSMFEALMVPLFVPEEAWAPESWGRNHPIYARSQIEYGRDELGVGVWGFSPASRPGGGYAEYGAPPLAMRPGGYPCGEPMPTAPGCRPVVTPHASFLALPFARDEAMANLEALEARFPIYGPFGFLDSVDVGTGTVSQAVLALDQGMVLAAIANDRADGAMRWLFSDGEVEPAIRPLIAPERFSAGPEGDPALASSESDETAVRE